MKNILVLLLAGKSKRFKNKTKKQFITINKVPLFCFSLNTFLKTKKIDKFILVINENDLNSSYIKFLYKNYKNYFDDNIFYLITGGEERYDSVYNALTFIKDILYYNKRLNVLFHDASRPFVKKEDIIKVINALKSYNSVSLSNCVTNTIKSIKNTNNKNVFEVEKTLNRDLLYEIYTPQGFNFDTIYNAYIKFKKSNKKINITDDLQIVELFSKEKTYLIKGDRSNIKITYNDDLSILKSKL